jgi:hypothetical protein
MDWILFGVVDDAVQVEKLCTNSFRCVRKRSRLRALVRGEDRRPDLSAIDRPASASYEVGSRVVR